MVYTSAMGTFMMGVVPVCDEGGGTHKGLVIYVTTVKVEVKGFEGTSEMGPRYRCSPAFRSGSSDNTRQNSQQENGSRSLHGFQG